MDSSKSLINLGKPTKRGIKKCSKCGMYNGTRGMICKNKHCDAIFKEFADKRKVNLDAVRLAGIVRQVYSVRVRDRGPDYRGFVQLPLCPVEDKNILSENALCFVDSCQRLFDDSILKCHETESNSMCLLCVHIDSAIKSRNMATPVVLKRDVLNSLNIGDGLKEKMWSLASENEGPLVQRVSRTVMAVKCQVSPKHPLGYLHFAFGCSKGRDVYDKYYCSCTEFTVSEIISKSDRIRLKCIHYYACIAALAGDPKFSKEFGHFTNYELAQQSYNYNFPVNSKATTMKERKISSKAMSKQDFKAMFKLIQNNKNPALKRCNEKYRKLAPKILPIQIRVLECEGNSSQTSIDSTSWKFTDWLSYVTESINQTMHFENYGNLNTLIFCVPQLFYDAFKNRIPEVYMENSGFSEVYHIMNILHLKQIFDTADMKLRISKRFFHDCKYGYVEYNEEEENESYQTNFIFFLNVGQSTVDESDNTNNSFLIEWIPNITEHTKIGQLKLQYKYGRKST